MTNSNHASYTIIGATVLAGLVAVVGTLVFIGGVAGDDDELLAETYFDKPVDGLSVGSALNFRGVNVGEVRRITFTSARYDCVSAADAQRVSVVLAIRIHQIMCDTRAEAEVYLRNYVSRGLRATVTTSGITGLSRIELGLFPDAKPIAPPRWKPEYVLIPPQPSLLNNLADSAQKLMDQMNAMDFVSLWSNLHAVVSSAARVSAKFEHVEFDAILTNLTAASASATRSLARLERLDVETAWTNATAALNSANRTLSKVERLDIQSVWTNLQRSAEGLAQLTGEATRLLNRERSELDRIVRNASASAATIDALAHKLNENPSLLLRPNDPEPVSETSDLR